MATPIEPHVDMTGFHFELDVHIDHVTSLAANVAKDIDTHAGYDFDEFDSSEDSRAPKIAHIKMKMLKEIRREYQGKESVNKGEFFVT